MVVVIVIITGLQFFSGISSLLQMAITWAGSKTRIYFWNVLDLGRRSCSSPVCSSDSLAGIWMSTKLCEKFFMVRYICVM